MEKITIYTSLFTQISVLKSIGTAPRQALRPLRYTSQQNEIIAIWV